MIRLFYYFFIDLSLWTFLIIFHKLTFIPLERQSLEVCFGTSFKVVGQVVGEIYRVFFCFGTCEISSLTFVEQKKSFLWKTNNTNGFSIQNNDVLHRIESFICQKVG